MSRQFPELNLPLANLRLKEENGETKVFDPIRQKWVELTPEEWVRQHFTAWLQSEFGYPASLIANEIALDLNGRRKRSDTVVFRRDGRPYIIVEYKAPTIAISQDVFDQIVRYNMKLQADYLIVSNGINHYCCKIDYKNNTYNFIPKIPDYSHIASGSSEN